MIREFRIIPAIDLLDGKVVRLLRGDYNQVTVYSDDPPSLVREFIQAGASLIHVVDLSAARNGDRKPNHDAIIEILKASRGLASIEIGGGIRSDEALQEYFEAGAGRCILGTSAVTDQEFLKRSLALYGGDRIIVGVDARDGRVKISGWEQDGGLEVFDFLHRLRDMGVKEVIFTDISTDGTLSGVPVETLKRVLQESDMRIIASGGVSSIEDIKKLLAIQHAHLVGVIAGRAIYDKKLDTAEAIRLVHSTMQKGES